MLSIKGKELDLQKALTEYAKGVTFIDIDVPEEDFKAIRNYNRLTKGKVDNLTVHLYNQDLGVTDIEIRNSNKLPAPLKEFLETADLATFGMVFDIKVLLNCGIKANIVHDMRCLMYLVLEGHVENIRHMPIKDMLAKLEVLHPYLKIDVEKLTVVEITERLYTAFGGLLQSEKYKDLIKVFKLCALSDYFGLNTDINIALIQKYLDARVSVVTEIEELWLKNYGVDIRSNAQVLKYLREKLGLTGNIRLSREGLKDLDLRYSQYAEVIEVIRRYKTTKAEIMNLMDAGRLHLGITELFEVRNLPSGITDKIRNNCLDIYQTESKKHYYIAIDSNGVLQNKYLEQVCNNITIPEDANYHMYIASLVFDKPITEITKEERRLAKYYNYVRWIESEPRYKKYINMRHFMQCCEDIETIPYKERVPYFKKGWFPGYTALLLHKMAVLQDTLDKLGDYSIVLSHKEYDCLVFKVSNKINPYRAMKLVADAMDTTQDIGGRLYSVFGIGNTLKEVLDFPEESAEQGVLRYKMHYAAVVEKYNSIVQEELRNVVASVKADFA